MNTCSTGAIRPFPNHAAYGSSKWALRGLTQAAAAELAPAGIRVNAVFPGPVETPMLDDRDPGAAGRDIGIGRIGKPIRDRRRGRLPGFRPGVVHHRRPNSSSTAANACKSMTRLSVGIIGAGPGGLALGIFLRKAGFRDFTIFDREDGVGGTWRINTYPGLACDVKSHLYSYSFDLNPHWSRLWSAQPEILEYFERCAEEHGLQPHLRARHRNPLGPMGCAMHSAWQLTTAAGEHHDFDVVVSAVGLFTQPVMPDLVEEEPFTGTVMHSRAGITRSTCRCAGRRAGHRIDCLAAGARAGEGGQEGLLGAAVADVDPAEAGPALHRRERWLFAHVPFAKKFYRTRLWLRSEANISVIENGSDKTQEFKATRPTHARELRWPMRNCAAS